MERDPRWRWRWLSKLGLVCGLCLMSACARDSVVRTLVATDPQDQATALSAGQELTFFERLEPGWRLQVTDASTPLDITVTWDGQEETQRARLDTATPSLTLASSGVARIEVRPEQEGHLQGMDLRGSLNPVQCPKAGVQNPNIVLYLVDTLRRDSLGVYGGPQGLTPNFDRFAAESTVYTQMFAASGWTKPSLASMFTGVYPRSHGCNTPTAQVRPEYPTLAEILSERGYSTAGFTPNPNSSEQFGFRRGFQEWSERFHESSEQIHARALRWLDEREASRPFFLYVHSIDPHDPYLAPPAYRARIAPGIETERYFRIEATPDNPHSAYDVPFDRVQEFLATPSLGSAEDAKSLHQLYLAEVAYNDAAFGAFVDSLKQRGLYQSTLIIVVSDHGEEFLEHGGWLHGGKLYQELIWVPLMIRFPEATPEPGHNATPVSHIDLFPSILAYAGGAPECDGRDLRATGPQRSLQGLAVPPGAITEALVDDGWKIIRTRHDEGDRMAVELYDLRQDPGEKTNLATSRPIRAGFLLSRLDALPPPATGEPAEIQKELQKGLRSLNYLR